SRGAIRTPGPLQGLEERARHQPDASQRAQTTPEPRIAHLETPEGLRGEVQGLEKADPGGQHPGAEPSQRSARHDEWNIRDEEHQGRRMQGNPHNLGGGREQHCDGIAKNGRQGLAVPTTEARDHFASRVPWPNSIRTRRRSSAAGNGLGSKFRASLDSPCGSVTSCRYPETNRVFMPGRNGMSFAASSGPVMPGISTSVTRT